MGVRVTCFKEVTTLLLIFSQSRVLLMFEEEI